MGMHDAAIGAIDLDDMLPDCAQGTISALNDASMICARDMLAAIQCSRSTDSSGTGVPCGAGGSCETPIAGLAMISDQMWLRGEILKPMAVRSYR
jgi:porphobilinogen deaminase